MKHENKQTETEVQLEFLAKILSWDYEKDITPLHVFVGYQLHQLTKAPFKQCVETAFEVSEIINKNHGNTRK